MILTSVGNQKVFEKVADAMLTQHPGLHEMETARPPARQFGSPNRWPSKGGQFEKKQFVKRKFVTKAFMAHACSDESCCSEQEEEESDGDENFTSYFCQSSGADDDFEDVEASTLDLAHPYNLAFSLPGHRWGVFISTLRHPNVGGIVSLPQDIAALCTNIAFVGQQKN